MKQRYMAVIFACIILFSSIGLSGGSAVSHAVTLQGFAGGTGTSEDPWQIATAAQLNDVRYFLGSTNDDKYFILVDNIDLGVSPYNDGVGWQPIGSYNDYTPFTGNFDGNGKTITGLYINDNSLDDVGLFGFVGSGQMQNVALTNVSINARDFVGGLVGTLEGTIINSFVTGDIIGRTAVGGLVGWFDFGNVENTWVAGTVTSISYFGGLIGENIEGTVTSSYYNRDISGRSDLGKGEPRSTADMTYPYNVETTNVGWDFVNIWDIQNGVNSGYPFIRQQIDPNAEFAGGNGSETDPYLIKTAAQLNNVRNYVGETHTDKHFLLMNNIDLTSYVSSGGEGYNDGKGWQPIGYSAPGNLYDYTNCFYGSFDGDQYTISGLMVNRQPTSGFEHCGLFGALIDAEVRNLNLSIQVTGTQFVGGLAGYIVRSTIDNIQVAGEVTGNNSSIGGLIGSAEDTVISDSSMTGTVSGTAGSMYTGGLIGTALNATITNCNTNAVVSGYYSIGGLAGHIGSATSMTGCYATGLVKAPINENETDIYTGGLVGSSYDSSISLCYATGDVSGSAWVGGLCGLNSLGTVTDSYAKGDVAGTNLVGGLIGENSYSDITNSYAVGFVDSLGTSVGGLVGGFTTNSIFNSFYDTQTTGQWSDNLSIEVKGTPKTTIEMKQAATFTGWDFTTTWGIVENVTYPYLQFEPIPATTYTVNFYVTGQNGTLASTVDSIAITTGTEIDAGKNVVFTASPAEGYRVKEWTLDTSVVPDNTTNTYSVEALAGPITVTVEFEPIPATTYTVNFYVTGQNGTLAATVDSIAITAGTEIEAGKNVVFTASPAEGYRVKEWTLDTAVVADNTTNTYSVDVLAGPITVTVEFEPIPATTYTVNFYVTGQNGTLAATVDSLAITAGTEIEAGKNVVFTASPAEGYRVKEWTLDTAVVADNTTNTYSVDALAGPITVTVEFESIPATTYTVNFYVTGQNGTLAATVDSIAITAGTEIDVGKNVVFTASPAEGYRVKEWTLDTAVVADNTTNTYSVEALAGPITVTVEFESIPATTYTVNFYVTGGNGTLAATVDSLAITAGTEIEAGKNVVFTASPAEGYRVKEWTLDTSVVPDNTTNTYSVEALTGPITVTVEFEPIPATTYTVNFYVASQNGTLAATVDSLDITAGTEIEAGKKVVFTASPAEGYRVKEWTLDTAVVPDNTTNTYSVEALTGPITVTVEFEMIPATTYTVNFSVTGGNGTLAATVDSLAITTGAEVDAGKNVVFTASPAEGYRVKEWTLDTAVVPDNTTNTYSVEALTGPITVTVEFELIPATTGYIVSVSTDPTDCGTVIGGGNYETGDRVKVSAIANENFVFINWTEGSTVVCKGATYNFKMGAENRNLVAHFKATVTPTSYMVTVSARPSEGGSVSGGGLYEEGALVEVVAIAKSGYRFINWTEELIEVSPDAVYSFTMGTTERKLTANFMTEGIGWPKEIKLSATDIKDTSVTLQLSQAVPDAKFYRVYFEGVLYKTFDATSFGAMKIDMLKPLTFYTFTVQALYSDDIETSDGPSIKVKTKK